MKLWFRFGAQILLFVALLFRVTSAQPDALVSRVIDVAFLTGFEPGIDLRAELPLAPLYRGVRDAEQPQHWIERGLSIDRLVETLRSAIDPQSWERAGHYIQPMGASLLVRHRPEIIDRINRYLAYLEASLLRPIIVDVFMLPASSLGIEAGPGVWTPEAVQRVLDSTSIRLAGRISLLPKVSGALRSGRAISYLGEYETEVAQDAEIADPQMMVLHEGLELTANARILPSNELMLRIAGSDCSLAELRVVATGSPFVGSLQLPRVDAHVFFGSGVVSQGGALVLGAAEGADDQVLLLRVAAGLPPETSQEAVALVPATPVGLSPWNPEPLLLGQPTASKDEGVPYDLLYEPTSYLDESILVDSIRIGVEPRIWTEDPSHYLALLDQTLFVKAPPPITARVVEFVTGMSRSLLRNVAIEIRVGRVDLATLANLAAGNQDLASAAGLLEGRFLVSTLAGEGFRLVIGRELAYLKDHDVEIAEDAVIADPKVSTLFSGMAIQGSIQGIRGDQAVLSAELVIQDLVGDMASFDGKMNDVGPVEVPRMNFTRARLVERLPKGRWVVVHLAPRLNEGDGLAVLARAVY